MEANELEHKNEENSQQPVVIASQRLLAFDADGHPVLINQNLENVNKQIVDKVNFSALMLPYRGKKRTWQDPETKEFFTEYVLPPEFEGLTNLEVAAIQASQQAADGDFSVFKNLLERLAGKSVEKTMSVSTKLDYKDFLEQLGNDSKTDVNIIDLL